MPPVTSYAFSAVNRENILLGRKRHSFVNLKVCAEARSSGKVNLPPSQTMLSHCHRKQRFFRVAALINIEASFIFLLARSSASLVACENEFSLTRLLNFRSFVAYLR